MGEGIVEWAGALCVCVCVCPSDPLWSQTATHVTSSSLSLLVREELECISKISIRELFLCAAEEGEWLKQIKLKAKTMALPRLASCVARVRGTSFTLGQHGRSKWIWEYLSFWYLYFFLGQRKNNNNNGCSWFVCATLMRNAAGIPLPVRVRCASEPVNQRG